jgi:CDP-glycerol glycerophosphotransferase (TagB/SpsB family)
LFASQYSLKDYSEFGDYPQRLRQAKLAFFEATSAVDGLQVVVKPHPLEDVHETRRLAAGSRNVVFADPQEDIRTLIPECDVFVTLGSTATMDALVQRKLVLFLAFPGLVWWDDMYLKSNATLVARSEADVVACIRGAIGKEGKLALSALEAARQRFLADWIGEWGGGSAKRVADMIAEMRREAPMGSETLSE